MRHSLHPALILRPARAGALPAAGVLLAACALLAGCASLAAQPGGDAGALAGHWVLDRSHSDDFDALLDRYIGEHRKKQRERMRSADNASSRDPREVMPLAAMTEEPGKERTRMVEELQPPAGLVVTLAGGEIAIQGEGEPQRRFVPGDKVTRIDVSGTAELECGWSAQAFVVKARYVNRAQRSWRYEVDRASGELRIDFSGHDPDYGEFAVKARYRRAS
jgi:hypothetical protein